MLPGKMNLAGDVEGLSFTIGDEPARVFWDREPVEMTADDALAAEAEGLKRGPEARRRAEAERLLKEALADGPRPGKDVEDELQAKGVAKRTLERARKALGIKSYQPMIPGPWFWRLPDEDNTPDRQETQDIQDRQVVSPGSETWRSGKIPEKNALFECPDRPDRQVSNPQGKLGAVGAEDTSELAPWEIDDQLEKANARLLEAAEVDGEEVDV